MPTKSVAPKKRAVAPSSPAAPVARVLVLRSIAADLRSGCNYVKGGFAHPSEVGQWVEAPDWDPTPGRDCGGGIHGWLWGEGDAGMAISGDGVRWQVYAVDPSEGLVSHPAKCRFRRGELVYLGDRDGATAYVLANGGHGRAVVYGTATAGDYGTATAGDYGTATAGYGGTATAGDYGTATAGDRGTATAGYGGTATAGDYGTATAGDYGTATAGDRGTATAGDYGTATAGYRGTATAGDYGTATAGDYGTATAGERGIIVVKWWDGNRYREAIGYTGEDGIKIGAAYRVVDGKLAEVAL